MTPQNFRKWMNKNKKKNVRWHFREWFSGSGRLSLTIPLAGLSVGFPVDYRYGWDVNNAENQSLLQEALNTFRPGVLHCAPDCAPWSVSPNNKDPQVRLAERLRDRPAINFVQDSCHEQARDGRGYIIEQPGGSAMIPELHMPGDCKKQKVDQCMHGAASEDLPIQKSTALMSNVKMNKTALRCNGHRGRPHCHLQGQARGAINRTALAAVYAEQLCQRLRWDISSFLQKRNLMEVPTSSFYECIRCQLGRYCPAGIDHTMIPGQCRHGRFAPGTNPSCSSITSSQ